MKNYFTLVLLIITSNLLAQTTLLFENFDGGFPAGWQTVDGDGLTPFNDPAVNFITDAWVLHEDYDSLGINDNILISNSWYSPAGAADDYIILPALTLGAFGNYISFDCKSKDQSYPDDFQILYSSSNLSGFTSNTHIHDAIAPSYWTNYTVSLDSAGITGQTIYLAFRHMAYDKFIIEIDNIKVVTQSSMDITSEIHPEIVFFPNPVTDLLTITGLTENTTYFITDINGKLIQTGVTLDKINVDNISKGFYFLRLGNTIAKKLVIK